MVWVYLSDLPLHFYNKKILRSIVDVLGTVIKIDYNTSDITKGQFARIVINVDFSKPLISKFELNDNLQKVEYEGLKNICFVCRRYGHRDNAYYIINEKATPNVAQRSEVRLEPSFEGKSSVESTYGPWMIAKTRYMKGSQSHKYNTGNTGSRFAILSDMIEIENMHM